MKNTMKRSLFAGLAALSFVAVAGASTNASAAKKSYKIDFNQASSSSTATSRNYVPTGSNALYTKAGVLKSARKVADTSTLQNLANSKKGNDYFRGYRVAKLSNGSYYMKVVTFDKAYRGWIYVGKTDPRTNYKNVNAGLKYTDTTTDTTSSLTDAQKKATYQIQNPGTTFEAQTFKAPAYTQYKIGRNTTDTTNYKEDTFTITQAAKRTREGDQWVYVNDAKNPSVNGWILQSSLKEATPSTDTIADNAIRINLTDATGKAIKSVDYTKTGATKGTTLATDGKTLADTDTSAINTLITNALAGTANASAFTSLSDTQKATLAAAKFGSAVTLQLGATKSVGNAQTKIHQVWNLTAYNSLTGSKQARSVGKIATMIPFFNSNVNFTNAMNKFNSDPDVKGNKNDVIPLSTLKAAFKKDGLDTVYLKITPTILPRIGGGFLDNIDPTGIYMKADLDYENLPTIIHYGDTIQLSYQYETGALYHKAFNQTIFPNITQNADGYYELPINDDLLNNIIDLIVRYGI